MDKKPGTHPIVYALAIAGVAMASVVCLIVGVILVLFSWQASREAARRNEAAQQMRGVSAALREFDRSTPRIDLADRGDELTAMVELDGDAVTYTEVEAVLREFDEDFHWSQEWDDNGVLVIDHGQSPRALFILMFPPDQASREVAVLIKGGAPRAPGEGDEGARFSLELPDDFLAGEFVSIDFESVRNLTKLER